MKLFLRYFFFLLLLLSFHPSWGQYYIQLTNQRTGKVRFFLTGDRIAFKTKHSLAARPERGKLQVVSDSGIWVNDHFIFFDSLQFLGESGLWPKFALGTVSTFAGAYMVTHIPEESNMGFEQYIVGQTLVGTGILQFFISGIKLITSTHYDLDKRWSLQVRKFKWESG